MTVDQTPDKSVVQTAIEMGTEKKNHRVNTDKKTTSSIVPDTLKMKKDVEIK